jgi:hypothetical protein
MTPTESPPAADPWGAALDALGGTWHRRRRRQAATRLFFAAWMMALVGVVVFLYLRLTTLEQRAQDGIAAARQEAMDSVLALSETGVLRDATVASLRQRVDVELAAERRRIDSLSAALAAVNGEAAALRTEVGRRALDASVDARFASSARSLDAVRDSVGALSARVDGKAELADLAALQERMRGKADESTVRDRLVVLRRDVDERATRAEVVSLGQQLHEARGEVDRLRERLDSIRAPSDSLR